LTASASEADSGVFAEGLLRGQGSRESEPLGSPLDVIGLAGLMERGDGRTKIAVGLLDGPVAMDHPDLVGANVREVSGGIGSCSESGSAACTHGTFVAGILCAKRDSAAPAICPGSTLLVRPIFKETASSDERMPSATPRELAAAIVESVDGGARVLNVSAAFDQPSTRGERLLGEALDHAARRGVIVVAAAGNQGTLGSSAITRHPWVIPVVGCDLHGRPMGQSNLGSSVGRRGLMAPGEGVTSLGAEGKPLALGGTSVAAPFVTGTITLLWSEFPDASAAEVKSAVTGVGYARRRTTVVPPLLDAWAAYEAMAKVRS
jgi:subtilisin family serine protease